jgi:hypothetical protein
LGVGAEGIEGSVDGFIEQMPILSGTRFNARFGFIPSGF